MKRYGVEIVVSMGIIEAANEDEAALQAIELFATTAPDELLLDVDVNVTEAQDKQSAEG